MSAIKSLITFAFGQTDGQKVEIFLDESFELNKQIGDIFTNQNRLSLI